MARYSVAGRSAGAGSTTLPVVSLYAPAAINLHIVEIGVFNTTATAVAVAVRRATTAGTQGAGLSEIPYDPSSAAATGTAVDTHTVGPTLTAGSYRQASLGAAIGSGVIWTFGNNTEGSLLVPAGTGNGICVIVGTGTGQVLDYYFDWDE